MKAEGMKVPAWVDEMLAAGRTSFYAVDDKGVKTYWDPKSKKAVALDEGKRVKSFTLLRADEGRIVMEVLAQRDAHHVRAID